MPVASQVLIFEVVPNGRLQAKLPELMYNIVPKKIIDDYNTFLPILLIDEYIIQIRVKWVDRQ